MLNNCSLFGAIFALLSALSCCSLAQDIIGCGGFVKSEVEIVFSLIEVKLYTRQGSLKYQTDCAPNNGYYMIPVYDKGDYTIRVEPPPGWTFEPQSVELHIDGQNDLCSKGEDINFQFTGFGVIGKVISQGQSSGPAGVTLTLKKLVGEETVKSTTSVDDGAFTFERVLPGEYFIEASHSVWKFEKSMVQVKVGRETGDAGSDLKLMGYDVQGSVLSEGEPVAGVYFLLFSSTVNPKIVKSCEQGDVAGMPHREGEFMICFVKSQKDGSFIFPAIPTGSYTLVPFYRGDNIFFDVQPQQLSFSVEQDSVLFKEPFVVAGFTVNGRVLTSPNGQGVASARVLVNGHEQAVTSADGTYRLDSMRPETYTIEVQSELIFFDPVEVKISPSAPQLPDVTASRFSVCGHVIIDRLPEGMGHSTQSRKVQVESAKTGIITTGTDGEGNFCFRLPAGTYAIKVMLSSAEEKAGLRVAPDVIDFTVKDQPLDHIKFSQFRATVSGSVECTEGCGSLHLSITSLGRSEERRVVMTSEDENGKTKFSFDNIMPGKYKVNLMNEEWCWEEKAKDIEVVDQNLNAILFRQSGYILSCHLSHDITLNFAQESKPGNVGSFNLTKGVNKFCLKEPGVYKLTPVSCHQFEQETYAYDTVHPSQLSMNAVRHRVEGRIVTQESASSIMVSVKSSLSPDLPPSVIGPLKSDKDVPAIKDPKPKTPVSGPFTYKYLYWAKIGEKLEVSASSKELLFYPETVEMTIMGDACPGDVDEIIGKRGVFIDGLVTPALADVAVTIAAKGSEDNKIEVTSDAKGSYRVGPLHSHTEYDVSAVKEGYVLTAIEGKQGQFRAFKLGQISVTVTDQAGQPLPGVLLSLSGGNYRSNQVTSDQGAMTFSSLSPGQYFLRPMMKEYSFEPTSQMTEVLEGTTGSIAISGVRVAFSCYGSVTSLNGEPEAGVYVEVVGLHKCSSSQEESKTEPDGSFRIRGLQPNCAYNIRLKAGEANQHIERSVPKSRILHVKNEDMTDVHMIAFRRMNQLDLSGNIIGSEQHLNTLKVHLYRESNPDAPIHTVSLGSTNFFYLPSLTVDNQNYVVRLDSTLQRSAYEYNLSEFTFTANTTYQHFTFEFSPQRKPIEQELSQSSFLVLPITLLVIFISYNYQKILPMFSQSAASLQSLMSPSKPSTVHQSSNQDQYDADFIAELTSVSKKKGKVRKA
ncbi:hypothetical protein CAPTEDRAFT_179513 [Capitella teleta]|uniref:ER membrane protein complex subunit 7 beta-sandwich domain-containing protein n=1 Tax=Capitella teleta TaxID=283909 RepID=R7THJ8_CAPTE|nr:hypothetical protein CAPTEDRAFT_179513 [Capitella teleta]|eukprot:ELT93278.1 hypothetical protein CAPTEDRAFT_179513 [Capitella teleta]